MLSSPAATTRRRRSCRIRHVLRDAPASYFRFGASNLAEGARDEKGVANAT
jgi:hypothetical protein